MTQEQDEIKRLDWLLHFMAIHAKQGLTVDDLWKRTQSMYPTFHIDGNESMQPQMIKLLVEDEYVIPGMYNLFSISIKGVLFDKKGGYATDLEKEIKKTQNQNLKDSLLVLGSLGAALGAIYLSLVDLWKKAHFLISIEMKSSLILFFSGMCIGAIALLAIQVSATRNIK